MKDRSTEDLVDGHWREEISGDASMSFLKNRSPLGENLNMEAMKILREGYDKMHRERLYRSFDTEHSKIAGRNAF